MRTETKLAPNTGASQKRGLQDIVLSARKALRAFQAYERPLRDIDGWSDQAEVAYCEEFRLGGG